MPAPRKEGNECEETSSKRIKLEEGTDSKLILTGILEKEIRHEINIRKHDLDTIEQRIFQTRQSLVKIRQGIVSEFYRQNSKGILQSSPHPAVKDTFQGKCPANQSSVDDDQNNHQVLEQVLDLDLTNIHNSKKNLSRCESEESLENPTQLTKLPRYIPPKYRDKDVVQLCEPRGNVKKKKFRISIINVSKWIFDMLDECKGATHKWTVYIKNSDPSIDVSSIVSKVTFFLHHSYKPNDVINVEYPPYKLTRRGWGEFPLRVQLHFINSLDKPVDVIHHLKLDTTHSGLDIFGNETVVDVWAHCSDDYEQGESTIEHDEQQEANSSPNRYLESLSSSPLKLSASEDYLSTSSLSQLTLTNEISSDILSEIFGDNESSNVKSEVEVECEQPIESGDSVLNSDHSCSRFKGHLEKEKEDYTLQKNALSEVITEGSTSNLNYFTYNEEQKQILQPVVDNNEFKAENTSNDTLLTENIKEIVIESSLPSQIDYNPIECFNFVNDEVVIRSEEDEISDNNDLNQTNIENSINCKNYFENFLQQNSPNYIENGDETNLISQELVIESHEDSSQQIVSNRNEQEIEGNKFINSAIITDSNVFENLSLDVESNSVEKLPVKVNNQINHFDTRAPITLRNSGTFRLTNIENSSANSKNNTKNTFIVKDLKNLIVSPIKLNNVVQCKVNNNFKNSNNKIENIIRNKNEAVILINNDQVTEFLVKNNDKVISNDGNLVKFVNSNVEQNKFSGEVNFINKNRTNRILHKKYFIEMSDGRFRELSSGSVLATDKDGKITTISNKPIIVESQPLNKRKTPLITSSGGNSVVMKSVQSSLNSSNNISMKKIILNPGFKIASNSPKINSNEHNTQQQNVRFMLKTLQKSKQRQLKPAASVATTSTGLMQSVLLKQTTTNTGTNVQKFIKAPTIQRKVLPGESLLKKGTAVQQTETLSRPDVSTSPNVTLLSDKELIKRCPQNSIEFAVSWLIKQLPLVNEKAGIEYFKTRHPYCAIDRDTFFKWPLAKQRAAEWMRAKKIGRLIEKVCPQLKQWTTLQILDWARLRGYTPIAQKLKCYNLTSLNKDYEFPFTAPDLTYIFKNNEQLQDEEDVVDIDVVSELEIKTKTNDRQVLSHERIYIPLEKNLKSVGNYIFKYCNDNGIHFYEEELAPGVVYPTVERLLISVFHSMVDDLFRRSLNASCIRNKMMPASEIILQDVRTALLSRNEFDIFTNEGLGISFNDQKEN